jgi:RNA polymerase sigma-70 factor (ECF subfamily)
MPPEVSDLNLDERVAALRGAGSIDEATTLVLQELGPSIFRYLVARVRDVALASDAFSRFSEDLWRGMPGYSARAPLRVWAYTIARNAAGQELRGQKRHRSNRSDFSETLSSRVADRVRTETVAWHRTEVKNQFADLRSRLDEEEQELLYLRVNEKLGWDEISKVHLGEGATPEDQKREAARLRKRFQLAREKLRKLARAEGLIDAEGASGRDGDG